MHVPHQQFQAMGQEERIFFRGHLQKGLDGLHQLVQRGPPRFEPQGEPALHLPGQSQGPHAASY